MTPIDIIYALSILLIVCGIVLVKCYLIIRGQDKHMDWLRNERNLEISDKIWYIKKIDEIRSKLPKRNPKTGRFQ